MNFCRLPFHHDHKYLWTLSIFITKNQFFKHHLHNAFNKIVTIQLLLFTPTHFNINTHTHTFGKLFVWCNIEPLYNSNKIFVNPFNRSAHIELDRYNKISFKKVSKSFTWVKQPKMYYIQNIAPPAYMVILNFQVCFLPM